MTYQFFYRLLQAFLSLFPNSFADTGSKQNSTIITPSFEIIFRLTEQYGAEAGVGGNVPWYTGIIPLTASVQDYHTTVFGERWLDWATSSMTGPRTLHGPHHSAQKSISTGLSDSSTSESKLSSLISIALLIIKTPFKKYQVVDCIG